MSFSGLLQTDAVHTKLIDLMPFSIVLVWMRRLVLRRRGYQRQEQSHNKQEQPSDCPQQPEGLQLNCSEVHPYCEQPHHYEADGLQIGAILRLVLDLGVADELHPIHAGVSIVQHADDAIEFILSRYIKGSKTLVVGYGATGSSQQQLLHDAAVAVRCCQMEWCMPITVLGIGVHSGLGEEVLYRFVTATKGCPVQGSAGFVVRVVKGQLQGMQEEQGGRFITLGCQMGQPHTDSVEQSEISVVLVQQPQYVYVPAIGCEVGRGVTLGVGGIDELLRFKFDL